MGPRFGWIEGAGRETRLLVVTLLVSVVLLLILAQFRFPQQATQSQPAPVAAPLERLSATATYDELARIIADVDRRVSPSILVLETLRADAAQADADTPGRVVPALRIRDDMGLVAIAPLEHIIGIVGLMTGPPELIGHDEVRGLAVVRIPSAPAPPVNVAPLTGEGARSRYVAVVEASRGGASVRPLFLARPEPVRDPRWPDPLLSLGAGAGTPPGSFVFTLRGEFVGVVTAETGQLALIPAERVIATAQDLANGQTVHRGDIGVTWQRLTPALLRASGATSGALVASIAPEGPAQGALVSGDVVVRINDQPIGSHVDARLAVATVPPGNQIRLLVLRGGATTEVSVLSQHAPEKAASGSADLGLELQGTPDGLVVRRVTPGSAGENAGLLPGDVITQFDRQAVTRPNVVTDAWREGAPGRAWLITVQRGGSTFVLAVQKL